MITHERGYLIPAFDTAEVCYTQLAQQLADSIRSFHAKAEIKILTNADLPDSELTGQALDSFVYQLSPFRQTIKLEADMIIASPIDHWWSMLQHRDVVVSTGCRDFYDQSVQTRFYRKIFDNNNLPDVYNAITYWRVSRTAKEFFSLVKNIFVYWEDYKKLLMFPDPKPTTDVVYGMAAKIVGPELVTMPFASYPKIVHMKKHCVPIRSEDWTKELVWEVDPLRIQTQVQWGAFHYVNKTWRP